MFAGGKAHLLGRAILPPEQQTVRGIALLEDNMALPVLLDNHREPPEAMGVLHLHAKRCLDADGLNRGVEGKLAAGRQEKQNEYSGKHHKKNEAEELFHFFVQEFTQSINTVYQSRLF